MRSSPSRADADLVATLEAAGTPVSAAQLERWRGWGLLPRAVVRKTRFGGSDVLQHEADVVDACTVLAGVMRPSRPWQYGAIDLFDLGFPLSTEAVREAAAFLLHRDLQPLRRAWAAAEVGAEPAGTDRVAWLAHVAAEAARVAGRQARRDVKADIAALHPTLSQPALKRAAERALAWRLADLHAPGYLTEQQRTWARHGIDEPLDPLRAPPVPLPSERAACIATLTWPEAALARAFLVRDSEDVSDLPHLLRLASWVVTRWRLDEDFEHPERPLPSKALHSYRQRLEDQLAEAGEDDAPAG